MPVGLAETGAVHGSSFLFYETLKGFWVRAKIGRALEPGEKPGERDRGFRGLT
jgi:hypothetical protein